jgi:hypothetical protein
MSLGFISIHAQMVFMLGVGISTWKHRILGINSRDTDRLEATAGNNGVATPLSERTTHTPLTINGNNAAVYIIFLIKTEYVRTPHGLF